MVPSKDVLTHHQLHKPRVPSFTNVLCFSEAFSETEGESHPLSVSRVPTHWDPTPAFSESRSAESHGAKALDLELKHVRLLLGQLGHLLPDGLHEGRGGDVGQGGVRGVVLCQALLRGRGGGHGRLLQAGVQVGRLAVLAREPGGRALLIPGPGVGLDVPGEGDLWRVLGEERRAWVRRELKSQDTLDAGSRRGRRPRRGV